MTFEECVQTCLSNKELVQEFNRLSGHCLGQPRSPIERMVDEATGRDDAALTEFFDFVFVCVWVPLYLQVKAKEIAND